MTMSAELLGNTILASIQGNIKAKYPEAIPMPFQTILANAIAKGFVKSLQIASGIGSPGQYQATGPGTGITGLSPDDMVAAAKPVFIGKIGSIGEALELILSAIYVPTVAHMAQVTVMTAPTSGFGGVISVISQMPPSLVLSNILAEIPDQYRIPMLKAKAGPIMFEAIATGFANVMLQQGKPAPIPMATTGSAGVTVAKFS